MLPQNFHFYERGWLSSNSLLIQHPEQTVLFDSGYVTHSHQLLQVLHHDLKDQPLDMLINSHLHSDHCGGNALLQSTFASLQTHIPVNQFSTVVAWDTSSLSFESTGQICPSFKPTHGINHLQDIKLENSHWVSYSSPGHDNDSLVFFEPDLKILLSADALWENGVSVIFPEFLGGIGFENVSKTYDFIQRLKPSVVIPGHGAMFTNYEEAIGKGRVRLDGFVKSPEKHALYSAKVLIKFKLLELHYSSLSGFLAWCINSSLLLQIHHMYFKSTSLKDWIHDLLLELETRKALRIENSMLVNL
jgi:glyoxylase-like metal-dependent hydrolase (beta-lactamase superfamily II)